MAETTIDWTDYSFNPWIGCTIATEGCRCCYAKVMYDDNKRGDGEDHSEGFVHWGQGGHRHGMSKANWESPFEWHRLAVAEGTRKMAFSASLGDVFDDHHSIDPLWRKDLWKTIKRTPFLDWQVLTKRPENIGPALCPPMADGTWGDGWENVWLGTSVENQKRAEERIPILLEVPSRIRFLSCEPLLGPLDLSKWLGPDKINWVIVGGESAIKERNPLPMKPEWVAQIKQHCEEACVAFFFKQWGNFGPDGTDYGPDGAGNLLGGKIYHKWPETTAPRPTRPVPETEPVQQSPPPATVLPAVKRTRGRPMKGERPMTSTERADAARKRQADTALRAEVAPLLAALGKNDRGLLGKVIGALKRAGDRRRTALLTVLAHAMSDKAAVRETVWTLINAAAPPSKKNLVGSKRDREPTDGGGD